MNLYSRLSQYHSNSRPSFVLFTELIAFVGSMATMVGFAYLRELLRWPSCRNPSVRLLYLICDMRWWIRGSISGLQSLVRSSDSALNDNSFPSKRTNHFSH